MQEWRELEKYYVEELGDSRHRAHQRIAELFFVDKSTVWRYLTYKRSAKHHKRRSYGLQVKHPSYKARQSLYRRFSWEPARFIAPLFQSAEEAISLEELSLRMADRYSYLPRLGTLERIAKRGNQRTDQMILKEVSVDPRLYRLAQEAHERYKMPSRKARKR